MSLSATTIERVFNQLVDAAVNGLRCPVTARDGLDGLPAGATHVLARDGRIRIEIFPKNYRRVTILEGPHTGKMTKSPPGPPANPIRVVDTNGVKERTQVAMRQPSPPRALTAAELWEGS